MGKYLRSEKINVEKIVNELFDFSKLGSISIPDVLTIEAREELLESIILSKHLFKEAKREMKSGVIQEMNTLYLERFVEEELPKILRDRIKNLTNEYSEIYERIAEVANFSVPTFNSIGINWYPIGSYGITPHKDYASDTNLITSFVLSGNAPFFVCRDKQKTDAFQLNADPGAIIFMRAIRNEDEQLSRPFHYLVGPIKIERYSILIRNKDKRK